jgi:hypothetical protein
MKIVLTNPLVLAGKSNHMEIKIGVFDVESDRVCDAHVLQPGGCKKVLPLWQGDEYTAKLEWSSDDVKARVQELHAAGELQKCF